MSRAIFVIFSLAIVASAHAAGLGFSYEDNADAGEDHSLSVLTGGQHGLAEKLKSVRSDEIQERRKADGLDGEMVLSSVGISGGMSTPEDPTSSNFDDMELVQSMDEDDQSWTPSGQAGLAQQLEEKHKQEYQSQLKEDGLKGNDMLSSAGMASDEHQNDSDMMDLELVQQWNPVNNLRGASPQEKAKKEERDAMEGKDDFGISNDEKASSDDENDLFGMVDIDVKLKEDHPDDELKKLGVIDTGSIHFGKQKKKVKGWLNEDDIQLVQKH